MAKKADHIANYFILPLIGFNKTSFGEGRFINSFLRSDNTVMVELKEPAAFYHAAETFLTEYDTNSGTTCAIFQIPTQFHSDLNFFREGKYSKFSEEAKNMIKQYSGLLYRVPHPTKVNKFITDERILALDKDPIFKSILEVSLGTTLDDDMELLSVPSEDEFVQATL